MSDTPELVYETDLDAPPEKVWRALSVPEYLDRWLQPKAAEQLDVVKSDENKSLTYRWRESGQGAVVGAEDSLVTFELKPTHDGGTWFKLTHAPMPLPAAANSNRVGPMMLAA